MIDFRLANVTFVDEPRSADYPNLYVRTSPAVLGDGSSATLGAAGATRYDFTTYLNAFSLVKWRKYTIIDNVWLHVRAKGSFVIEFCRIDRTSQDPQRTVLARRTVASQDYLNIEYEFHADDATMLSFHIVTTGPTSMAEAYYYTRIDEDRLRPVELALATTTFKKEDYITANVALLKREILGCDEPVADHFTMHVIDNGRTLDVDALQTDRVRVYPNDNVGGSGGFARGMICALEQQPKATHVLLMDDDVQVLPEAIKRTYNVLALVNDEYEDALVSGAMMAYEEPDRFHEDTGFVLPWGAFAPLKSGSDVNSVKQIVKVECIEPHGANRYAGWWYCCIPTKIVERDGLPLPFFVRADDVEYGNRAKRKFITMNGICIWHLVFGDKFRSFFERYLFVRNTLIAQAASGNFDNVDFFMLFKANVQLDFKNFRYEGVELALIAVEDFLKGPEFIMTVNPEDVLKTLGATNVPMVPIDEIDDERVQNAHFNPKILRYRVKHADDFKARRGFLQKAYDYGTQNGQRFVPSQMDRNGLAIVQSDGWANQSEQIRGCSSILEVSPDGSEGILRKKDVARFKQLDDRFQRDVKEFERRREELREAYRAAYPVMTSMEFWKHYLKLD